MEWAKNWVIDKVSGYAKTGIQAGGTLAGNAVGSVGSLVENTGRSVGQGAIGGVGGYINNYGDGIKNSMAADGPVSGGGGEKKMVGKRTANGTVKTGQKALPPPAAGSATRALPSTMVPKSLPTPSKTHSISPRPASLPSKLPAPTNRNLPAKKPTSMAVTKPPTPRTAPRGSVSTRQSQRPTDGRVKISAASRPQPVRPSTTTSANPATSNDLTRPTPVRAAVPTGQSERNAAGKVKISAASRPRSVRAN